MGYVARSLGIAVLLIALSFLSAGFSIRSMALPLAVWGALALLYGVWRLATLSPAESGSTAVRDMRGQAGGNLLANYTNRQEYKLAKLREDEKRFEQQAGVVEEPEHAAEIKERAQNAVCMVIAGVLALVLSWLAGQVFPH
jgi:hypothetical protein